VCHDVSELVQHPPDAQGLGVVGDRLQAQHTFALGVRLDRQQTEVNLEDGQVVRGSLDRGRQLHGGLTAAPGTAPGTEQPAQPGHVQPGTDPVEDGANTPVHHRTGGEQQVPGVLDLVDRVRVPDQVRS